MTVRWQRVRKRSLGRHTHLESYAAVLLKGSYREVGDRGVFTVTPGLVVLHEAFESHSDYFGLDGAWILDITLPPDRLAEGGLAKVRDVDAIARMAERYPHDAGEFLLTNIVSCSQKHSGTSELLAAELTQNPSLSLGRWAARNGIRPWTLSREFIATFGVSPRDFRARSRARIAWRMIQRTRLPLSTISQSCGFSDQAHMTRSVGGLTGLTPGAWRNRRLSIG